MYKTILIIEDEEQIAKLISDYFMAEGFKIVTAYDGVAGLEAFEASQPDLIILDIMLPLIDGFSVCKRIRKKSDVPIIMLTARSEVEDQLMGYEFKVDDYITKPFNPEILVAKAGVLLERLQKIQQNLKKAPSDSFSYHGVMLSKPARKVWIDEVEIELEPKQFDILLLLIENKNIVISREQILNEIWGYDFFGNTRVVDSQIKKLRKQMKHKAYLIETVFGIGYKFEVK